MNLNINWYPGHMKKTRESIQANLKLVDVVFELLDARIPISSKNPIIDELIGEKPRIVILNKSDLASDVSNRKWTAYYNTCEIPVVLLNSLSGKGIDELVRVTKRLITAKREAAPQKGMADRPIRAMIVGVPNVGKSTLINSIARRKGAKTGNRPGVTKTNQWIKSKGGIELLDTPGILWPKFEDPQVGLNLAFTGAIKDEILDVESIAFRLIEKLNLDFSGCLNERYDIETDGKETLAILDSIALRRGCIIKGGEIDYDKSCRLILDEFRKGHIGRITLEDPEGEK